MSADPLPCKCGRPVTPEQYESVFLCGCSVRTSGNGQYIDTCDEHRLRYERRSNENIYHLNRKVQP